MKNCATLTVILLLSISAAVAGEPGTPIWDMYVEVDFAYDGNETLTLFNLPDGMGSSFSQAHLPNGSLVDATLRVQLLDAHYDPVASFPAEDMWLEAADGGLAPCVAGTVADFETDSDGWTVWAAPMQAGGFSTAGCRLYINGMTPELWSDLDLQFNSCDINGDGIVNLQDLQPFATSFFGEYSFETDFFYDGVLNLMDVGLMAMAMGGSCP